MKTEDGNLVPMPEKSKILKSCKIKTIRKENEIALNMEKNCLIRNINEQIVNADSQQLQIQSFLNSEDFECPSLSLEFTNSINSISQIFSIVDVNTGQVLTIEVANPELLTNNELIDQFGTSCNEILNSPYYQHIDFQNNFLNTDETYYNNTNYAFLENIEVYKQQ